jgi:hypothetical protein
MLELEKTDLEELEPLIATPGFPGAGNNLS